MHFHENVICLISATAAGILKLKFHWSQRISKVTSAVTKGFPKAANSHKNGFPKATAGSTKNSGFHGTKFRRKFFLLPYFQTFVKIGVKFHLRVYFHVYVRVHKYSTGKCCYRYMFRYRYISIFMLMYIYIYIFIFT